MHSQGTVHAEGHRRGQCDGMGEVCLEADQDGESSLLTSTGEGRRGKVLSLLVQAVPQQDPGLDRSLVANGGGRCRNTLKVVDGITALGRSDLDSRSRWHLRAS